MSACKICFTPLNENNTGSEDSTVCDKCEEALYDLKKVDDIGYKMLAIDYLKPKVENLSDSNLKATLSAWIKVNEYKLPVFQEDRVKMWNEAVRRKQEDLRKKKHLAIQQAEQDRKAEIERQRAEAESRLDKIEIHHFSVQSFDSIRVARYIDFLSESDFIQLKSGDIKFQLYEAEQAVMEALDRRARRLGANAIIDIKVNYQSVLQNSPSISLTNSISNKLSDTPTLMLTITGTAVVLSQR